MKILKTFRPLNLLMVALVQLICYYVLINPFYVNSDYPYVLVNDKFVFLLIFITLLITISGYLINDLFDIQTDKLNKKSKGLSEKYLLNSYLVVTLSGFVLSWYVAENIASMAYVLIYPIAIAGLFLYSSLLQRQILLGNFLVAIYSACVVGIFLLTEWDTIQLIDYAHRASILNTFIVFMAFCFLASLQREIIKDVEDLDGDQSANYKTLPIVHGIGISCLSANVVGAALILLIVIFLLQSNALYFIGILLIVIEIFIIIKTKTAKHSYSFGQISLYIKFVLLIGIIYFALSAHQIWTS